MCHWQCCLILTLILWHSSHGLAHNDADCVQIQLLNPLIETEKQYLTPQGWWIDGTSTASIQDNKLFIACSKYATGVYHFTPLNVYGQQIINKPHTNITLGFNIERQRIPTNTENKVVEDKEYENFCGAILHFGDKQIEFQVKPLNFEKSNKVTLEYTFQPQDYLPNTIQYILLAFSCTGDPVNFWENTQFVLSNIQLRATTNCPSSNGTKEIQSVRSIIDNCPDVHTESVCLQNDHDFIVHKVTTLLSDNAPKRQDLLGIAYHGTIDRMDSIMAGIESFHNGNVVLCTYHGQQRSVSSKRYIRKGDVPHSINLVHIPISCNDMLNRDDVELKCRYPINYLRNIAMEKLTTPFILNLDADIVPSLNIVNDLKKALASDMIQSIGTSRVAFVLPVFEETSINRRRNSNQHRALNALLTSKQSFLRFVEKGRYDQYKKFHAPSSHGSTDYERWKNTNAMYEIEVNEKYEPYIILDATSEVLPKPLFDERFTGYGWNKIASSLELKARNYRFFVLPNSWLIHMTHAKSDVSVRFSNSFRHRALNRIQRYISMSKLFHEYKLGDCA